MASFKQVEQIQDPVEMLEAVLGLVWDRFCQTYWISTCMPEMQSLFEAADLNRPFQAAKVVITNMLLEVSTNVSRFSPWYTRPAREFGLLSMRNETTGQAQWMLAPEAVQKWQTELNYLATAIDQNYSVLRALIYMDTLMGESENPCQPPLIITHCQCNPPRSIRLTPDERERGEVRCEMCLQLFH